MVGKVQVIYLRFLARSIYLLISLNKAPRDEVNKLLKNNRIQGELSHPTQIGYHISA